MTLTAFQVLYENAVPLDTQPSEEQVRSCLTALVKETGLTPIGDPLTHFDGKQYAAIQLIAESHCAIDGYGTRCFATVFACARFDADGIADVLKEHLGNVAWSQKLARNWTHDA